MSTISTILARLRAAIWAIDVRDDIANAIEQCYSDVSNPTLKTEALEAALQTKIDEGEMAALTIGDGTITGAKLVNGTITKVKLDPSITFDADAELDTTSTNAIQNKVVASELATVKADLGTQSDTSTLTHAGKLNASVSNGMVTATSYGKSAYYDVGGAKIVNVSKTAGKTFIIGFTEQIPVNNAALSGIYINSTGSKITETVPASAKYLLVYYFNANKDSGTEEDMFSSIIVNAGYGAKDVSARTQVSALSEEISAYGSDIETSKKAVSSALTLKDSGNLFDGVKHSGYIDKSGVSHTGSYQYTNMIDIHDRVGETIKVYNNGQQKYIRFVCVYDSEGVVLSALGSNDNAQTFTIPQGAYYVVLSFTNSSVNTPNVLITTGTGTIYVPKVNSYQTERLSPTLGTVNLPKPNVLEASVLANSGILTVERANSVKRLGTYVLYCVPGEMSEDAYIIFGKDSSKGYAVGISATKWQWFVNNVAQGGGTHGLTIKDYLLVVVDKVPGTGAVLTIHTNGGTYTRTNTSWTDDHGAPYVLNNSGAEISNVKMTWTSSALRNRNWVFGDSYVTIATTRWPKYVYELGFGDNLMINGYPGEQSAAGYEDFISCLELGTPTICAWCLGMNDVDDGDVNADWLKYTQTFLRVCAFYDITPILATIPCCPIAEHRYKNAWVRESGYRYIDFASAVNIEQDSTTWHDDMLHTDNIHPTAIGAVALATQVLLDYPELLCK